MARVQWRTILRAAVVPFGLALGLAVVAAGHRAAAADTGMRCEGRIVSRGDSAYEVREICGEPDDVQRSVVARTVSRIVRAPCPDNPRAVCRVREEVIVEVIVERWTYDFGNRRLIRYVTFEDGRLVYVETGGRGRA